MKRYVQSYLSSLYYISTSELGNDGVYSLTDDRKYKSPLYGEGFLKELIDIFGCSEEETKTIVYEWAIEQKPDVDLTFFWSTKEDILTGIFPIIERVAARTIAQELVSVQPMSTYTGELLYFNVSYEGVTGATNQNGRNYEVAENDAGTRFENIIRVLGENQDNYIMGIDPINLDE
jgi:hypothetical protein